MKKFYISFGQIHAHAIPSYPTFDKDCIAVIKAETAGEAHDKAFELFGGKFSMVYNEIPDMMFFPRGLIEIQ